MNKTEAMKLKAGDKVRSKDKGKRGKRTIAKKGDTRAG